MAISRYNIPARQPVVDVGPTEVRLPFDELYGIARDKMARSDMANTERIKLAGDVAEVRGLNFVSLADGERLPVADAEEIKIYKEDFDNRFNTLADNALSGDPASPQYLKGIYDLGRQFKQDVSAQGVLGPKLQAAVDIEEFENIKSKDKNLQTSPWRAFAIDRQMKDYAEGRINEFDKSAGITEYVDYASEMDSLLSGIDEELISGPYAVSDGMYIRQGKRSAIEPFKIRNAARGLLQGSKIAQDMRLRKDWLTQVKGYSDQEADNILANEWKSIEDGLVSKYRGSSGTETLKGDPFAEIMASREDTLQPAFTFYSDFYANPNNVGMQPFPSIGEGSTLSTLSPEETKELQSLNYKMAQQGDANLVLSFFNQLFGGENVIDQMLGKEDAKRYNELLALKNTPVNSLEEFFEIRGVDKLDESYRGIQSIYDDLKKQGYEGKELLDRTQQRYESKRENLSKLYDRVQNLTPAEAKSYQDRLLGTSTYGFGEILNATIIDPETNQIVPFENIIDEQFGLDAEDLRDVGNFEEIGRIKNSMDITGRTIPLNDQGSIDINIGNKRYKIVGNTAERALESSPLTQLGEVINSNKKTTEEIDISSLIGIPGVRGKAEGVDLGWDENDNYLGRSGRFVITERVELPDGTVFEKGDWIPIEQIVDKYINVVNQTANPYGVYRVAPYGGRVLDKRAK